MPYKIRQDKKYYRIVDEDTLEYIPGKYRRKGRAEVELKHVRMSEVKRINQMHRFERV